MSGTSRDDIRVRIAPSPTGSIHLGLARTTLFNWAFARHHGGTFVLRVEDTDKERSTKESEQAILDGFRWLGVDWDEGPGIGGPYAPYHQSERVARHMEIADGLLEAGHAYRCFCTRERLGEMRAAQEARKETPRYDGLCRSVDPAEAARRAEAGEDFTVRFRVPEGQTTIKDLVRGTVTFQNVEVDDWIMVRQGGNPTYNFVVVCDDADMRISHVFRGEEHLTNTPKQVLLYQALGLEAPRFGHLPLMLGKDGKKLSKRHGDVSLGEYVEAGYSQPATINFLARQGWALDGETEIFSVERFVEAFDISGVSKGGSIFDFEKFAWMSGQYVQQESLAELAAHCAPYLVAAGLATAEELAADPAPLEAAVAMGQERVRLYSEMPATIGFLYAADEDLEWDEKAEKNARKHADCVTTLKNWFETAAASISSGAPADQVRQETKDWVAGHGLKFPQLFQPLRCVLTGQAGGPDLFDVIAWLGPERTSTRLLRGLQRLG